MNVKTHPSKLHHWSIFGYCRSCTTHFDAYSTIKIRHSSSLIYLYYIIPFEDIQQKYWTIHLYIIHKCKVTFYVLLYFSKRKIEKLKIPKQALYFIKPELE